MIIRLDQRPPRFTVDVVSQLPHGVVHALEAGVDAESSGRWKLVGGVTAEQYSTLDQSFDDGGVQLPQPELEYLGFEIVDPNGGAYPVPCPLVGEHVE